MKPFQKTLFNKNHVTVTLHNYDKPKYGDPKEANEFVSKYVSISYVNAVNVTNDNSLSRNQERNLYNKARNWRPKYEYIKKESPLGFYYTKTICTNLDEQPSFNYSKKITETKSSKVVTIRINEDKFYTIVYPISLNEVDLKRKYTNVGLEIRPWQLFDGSWEDHYTTDLLKVLNEVFFEANESKIMEYDTSSTYSSKDPKGWTGKTCRDVQLNVYLEMFGNQDGPKYQTNNEKILAAGFDLKTSFRKDKES